MKTIFITILVLFVIYCIFELCRAFIKMLNLPKIRLNKKQSGTVILITYLSISVLYCIIVSVF
jgi:hypothetical protein